VEKEATCKDKKNKISDGIMRKIGAIGQKYKNINPITKLEDAIYKGC
jgi:hypothetical protein